MLFTSEGRVDQETDRLTGVVLAVSRHYTGGCGEARAEHERKVVDLQLYSFPFYIGTKV